MKHISSIIAGTAVAAAALCNPFSGDACSRIVYHGSDSLFIVARSLDWKTPIPTNIYVYPRGMEKRSSDQPGAITWKSKYGAVYAVGYDGGVTEGMNEKGLVINGLFCKGTVYVNKETEGRPPMSLAMFVAWMLDNYATVDETVAELSRQNFTVSGATFDGGTVSALHWGLTDATGKSVILEFDNGNVKTYDMGDYRAMTNDPQWPQMRAIIDYWNKIGGKNMLPGTVTSPDRCVRGNYFAHHVRATKEADLGVSIARSILYNCSVPYTYEIEGEPNLSSTQWRSYSNTRDLRYYFEVVTNSGIFYVDLNKVDLRPGAKVLKIETTSKEAQDFAGEASKLLHKAPPFTPMY